jgi:cytochrome c-type biogenesis protein CcmH/NrfG
MKRDLVFFLSGIVFGAAAGYFLFRTLAPESDVWSDVAERPASVANSAIGLDAEPDAPSRLDETEIAKLEAEASDNPSDAAIRTEIGRRYMDADRFSEALVWLEEAVQLAPSEVRTRNYLAIAYLNLGRLDNAVSTYARSLEIDPHHPASLLGLGRIKLYIQQDIQGGLALWETLVSVAPDSAEARSVREELAAIQSAHPG